MLTSERIYACLIIAALSLAFLVLPYLIRTTQITLKNLPLDMRRTAPGATKLQNIFYALIPRSLTGTVSGVTLSIGCCAEDTMENTAKIKIDHLSFYYNGHRVLRDISVQIPDKVETALRRTFLWKEVKDRLADDARELSGGKLFAYPKN